jgi:endonuclease YncB( thermonuclease family)
MALAAPVTIWVYPRCFIVDVHDGDTIKVDIDFGQHFWVKERSVRLDGISARELREEGGKEARDALAELLPVGAEVRIESKGWDKYGGRIDGIVYLPDGRSVQAWLIEQGWAVRWNAKGVPPKPRWPRMLVPLDTL